MGDIPEPSARAHDLHALLSAAFLIFPAGMALAASMDLLTLTIPNKIIAGILAGYLLFAAIAMPPWPLLLWNFPARRSCSS